MISLDQLLNIKEFKFCPYKKFLPYAFDLDEKHDSTNMVNYIANNCFILLLLLNYHLFSLTILLLTFKKQQLIENHEDHNNDILLPGGYNQMSNGGVNNNNGYGQANPFESKRSQAIINQGQDIEMNNNNRNKSNLQIPGLQSQMGNMVSEASLNQNKFIDFRKFCDIMKYFTPKSPFDCKSECNFYYFTNLLI